MRLRRGHQPRMNAIVGRYVIAAEALATAILDSLDTGARVEAGDFLRELLETLGHLTL